MGMKSLLKVTLAGAVALAALSAGAVYAQDKIGLITKTEGNPFFVKMREGAQAKAEELGLELHAPSPASSTATTTARSRRSRA